MEEPTKEELEEVTEVAEVAEPTDEQIVAVPEDSALEEIL